MIVSAFLATIAVAGCSNGNNSGNVVWKNYSARFVKDKLNTEIILPDSLFLPHHASKSEIMMMTKSAKVLFCVDVECGTCLGKFHYWKKFALGFRSKYGIDAPILAIVKAENRKYANRIVNDNWTGEWIFDKNSTFIHCNDIEDDRFQAMLLDSDNIIRIIGNPIFNEPLGNLYENTLSKMLSK